MKVIGLLDGSAAGDRKGRVVPSDGDDAIADEVVGSTDPTDGIVNLLWAVDGDNDLVEEGGDLVCTFLQKQTCGQESEVDVLFAEEIAEGGEIVVQQWFAASENHLTNIKASEGCAMTLKILRSNLVVGVALPDVAHDTATVAATVGVENENRQSGDPRRRR
jgi:hypothetical protein